MIALGIIAEFNPFHNGHQYLIEKARKKTKADIVVIIMSGNFLQRGEPAIIDKWTRAKAAVENSADLVVELPPFISVQSADYFANGGVIIAHALKLDYLAFGTDAKEVVDYQKFGEFSVNHQETIEKTYQDIQDISMSYAQKMTQVYRELLPDFPLDFTSPNHILAMSYAKANAQFEKPMKLVPIKRKKAHYHSQEITIASDIASATAIRQSILKGNEVHAVVPAITNEQLNELPKITWESYWLLLKYKIQSSSIKELQQIYQMNEGLEYRLKEKVNEANNFEEFIQLMKTKRYTRTRLQRLFVYVLWNMKKLPELQDIKLLATNQIGRNYLKQEFFLPIISKVGRDSKQEFSLKVDQIYQLGHENIQEQNFGRFPYIKKTRMGQNSECVEEKRTFKH
ncbi:MAG: nucleotidyltransferase [Streptococcaceae bacterium]|jgi:cytidyltransferase-like protein|nr:nucleotidyltransferase [Streptococcaceae bacterium]